MKYWYSRYGYKTGDASTSISNQEPLHSIWCKQEYQKYIFIMTTTVFWWWLYLAASQTCLPVILIHLHICGVWIYYSLVGIRLAWGALQLCGSDCRNIHSPRWHKQWPINCRCGHPPTTTWDLWGHTRCGSISGFQWSLLGCRGCLHASRLHHHPTHYNFPNTGTGYVHFQNITTSITTTITPPPPRPPP